MKVKDIAKKTKSLILISINDEIVCDNVGCMGNFEDYENSNVKEIDAFYSRTGLYKKGIILRVKDDKSE